MEAGRLQLAAPAVRRRPPNLHLAVSAGIFISLEGRRHYSFQMEWRGSGLIERAMLGGFTDSTCCVFGLRYRTNRENGNSPGQPSVPHGVELYKHSRENTRGNLGPRRSGTRTAVTKQKPRAKFSPGHEPVKFQNDYRQLRGRSRGYLDSCLLASFPALLDSNVSEATFCRQSTFSPPYARRLASSGDRWLR
jgi:hypothetical protein